ncbi:MAG TPA: ATP-binding protein, partial [Thermoleophilaceae bacterium]|nr:ATP-binding protein [Thermoleophilaceae bacterium]
MDRTLVERVREVEELYSLIGDTAKGEGAVALIEGTAGVGKSSLLAQVRARAQRDGARVLTARGSELESLFTFGVVRQLFEGVLADKKARAGALKGAAAPAEAAFGPPGDDGEPGGSESFTTL